MSERTTTPPILPMKKAGDSDEVEKPETRELPYNFEKELIEKQNRYFCGHYTFVPRNRVPPLTGKLHAKHDQNNLNYEKFLVFVTQQGKRRGRGILPHLSNESYGWLPLDCSTTNINDLNFICAPKIRTDLTVYGEKLANERVNERPPFNGLRFFF